MDIIDVSLPLFPGMPAWPGSPGFQVSWIDRIEMGGECNHSRLDCDTHIGTHVDVPLHFVRGGNSLDAVPLDIFVGPAFVAYLPDAEMVTADDLASLALPPDTRRLLLRTRNSLLWADGVVDFVPDFAALTEDAARWVIEQGIRLVGVDYLSVEPFESDLRVHRLLLGAGVVVLEGLNLGGVEQGEYELICLPLKIVGAEGAPARAVLKRCQGNTKQS